LARVKFRSRLVHRLEFAAVNDHQCLGKEVQTPAQDNELTSYSPQRLAVVLADVRDRLVVRWQPLGQPHQFHVALRLALKTTAGLNPMEVTVDVELQQRRGMIGRSAGLLWFNTRETQLAKIEFINERINDSDRVIFFSVIIQAFSE
jgi:hypothetical protein